MVPESSDSPETELLEDFSRTVPADYKDTIVKAAFVAIPGERYSHRLADCITAQEVWSHLSSEPEARQLLLNVPLDEQGEELKRLIKGKDFIDLGCGVPSYSFVPRIVAERLKARRYIGVDAQYVNKGNFTWTDETVLKASAMDVRCSRFNYGLMDKPGKITGAEFNNGFPSYWMADDMLGAVSKYTGQKGVTFFLAGIQTINQDVDEYLKLLAKEIARVSRIGDAVIGVIPIPGALTQELIQQGFSYTCTQLEVFIKQ